MRSISPDTMTTPVLTEDTLKALEELLEKLTPGEWRADPHPRQKGVKRIWVQQKVGMSHDLAVDAIDEEDADTIVWLLNNAAELLRGYRVSLRRESN